MPVVTTTGGLANQVSLLSQPASTQMNFREMVGRVLQWNPDAPPLEVEATLRDVYRRLLDERLWYGTLVRGELTVPDLYSTGTVSVVADSDQVTGVGTAWDATWAGRQFRIGLTLSKPCTIKSVESATSMTLDLPWGSNSQSGVAYQIYKSIVSFGDNIKLLRSVVNVRQCWRCTLNIPQDVLDAQDPQRSQSTSTRIVANHPASSAGEPMFELWPRPTTRQPFPFLAHIQPPDLLRDDDYPVSWIRSDILVYGAIPPIVMLRKESKYYNENVAGRFEKLFAFETKKMERMDDNHYQTDLIWDYDRWPTALGGPDWAQTHE